MGDICIYIERERDVDNSLNAWRRNKKYTVNIGRCIQRAAKLRPRHRAKTQSNKAAVSSICLSACSVYLSICPLRLSKIHPKIHPKSFRIVAKMVQNRGLEGAWSCFEACLRPKAPVGGFLDGSGAALGRLLAHLGRFLGGSWVVLGARLGRPRAS